MNNVLPFLYANHGETMTFEIVTNIILTFIRRNRIMMIDRSRKATQNMVNLQWWENAGKEQNVGDALSPVVVAFLKERNGIRDDRSSDNKTKHLYAIGSIIDTSYQDATVWGSGILNGNRSLWWRKLRTLDIRCVRGPETRSALMANGYECPECYGDPAVLMPLIYDPTLDSSHAKAYEYRVIRHHSDSSSDINSLSPITADYKAFIDELTKCKRIVSSSLHGIILAEAYGIPAVLLKHDLNMFKYEDYYHSTGRYDFPVAGTVEEALTIEPAPLPDLKPLQDNLIKSFPVDLWARQAQ